MKKGTLLICLGILYITAGLGMAGYNIYDNWRAGKVSSQATDQIKTQVDDIAQQPDIPDYVLYPDMEMPTETVGGVKYVGMISFPLLDKELAVISKWNYPRLRIAPCRFSGSVYKDNMIICAHNFPSHFGKIKNLNYGDRVIFTDMDGNIFTYEVIEMEILTPKESEELQNGDWDLTLFTCTLTGGNRFVVRCERVKQ